MFLADIFHIVYSQRPVMSTKTMIQIVMEKGQLFRPGCKHGLVQDYSSLSEAVGLHCRMKCAPRQLKLYAYHGGLLRKLGCAAANLGLTWGQP